MFFDDFHSHAHSDADADDMMAYVQLLEISKYHDAWLIEHLRSMSANRKMNKVKIPERKNAIQFFNESTHYFIGAQDIFWSECPKWRCVTDSFV